MVGLVQHCCSDSDSCSDSELGSDSGKNSFDGFDGSAALNDVLDLYYMIIIFLSIKPMIIKNKKWIHLQRVLIS